MTLPLLVIGNRNYSSWSLRAWLALRHCGYAFDTVRLSLDTPQFGAQIRAYSPAGRVPVLVDRGEAIWDSLAIAEYAHERAGGGWPEEPVARAVARAVSCEMHSGFESLRASWPMDIRARREAVPDARVSADLARIEAIFADCRVRFGAAGPWLFGRYSIADACYAPVVCRLQTYAPGFGGPATRAYCAATLHDPHLTEWATAAAAEPESLI